VASWGLATFVLTAVALLSAPPRGSSPTEPAARAAAPRFVQTSGSAAATALPSVAGAGG